jgi:glutamyl-tRNA synthetase
MSKRHGATSIREYLEEGFLPEAVVNYLSLLGWSPGNNQELIGREELVKKFELKKVLKTGAIFSHEKLEWMNKQYLKKLSPAVLAQKLIPYLEAKGYWGPSGDLAWLEKLAKIYQDRIGTLSQFSDLSSFFFKEEIEYQTDAVTELRKDGRLKEVLRKYADLLEGLPLFEPKAIEEKSVQFMKETGLTPKEFIHPCRMAITGGAVSPGFYDTVSLIGKEKAVRRLRFASEKLI